MIKIRRVRLYRLYQASPVVTVAGQLSWWNWLGVDNIVYVAVERMVMASSPRDRAHP